VSIGNGAASVAQHEKAGIGVKAGVNGGIRRKSKMRISGGNSGVAGGVGGGVMKKTSAA
jgi:hypothetical protein